MRPSSTYRAARRNAEKTPEVRAERKAALRRERDHALAMRIAAGPVPALTEAQRFAKGKALEAERRALAQQARLRANLAWAILHPQLPGSRAILQANGHDA